MYSAAEYASPDWCRSTHARKLDVALNDPMRIITGCMRPTETTFLPVLAGIMPPDIRREARVAKLTVTAKNNSEHIYSTTRSGRVSARKDLYHAARSADTRPDHLMTITILPRRGVIALITVHPHSDSLPSAKTCDTSWDRSPRKQWVKLNRLRCGTARVGDTLKLWGAQESAMCACGHITQSVQHVVVDCMTYKAPDGFAGLRCPDAALHCTALHYTALHCIALHCIALHCIVLYCIVLYCIVLYCIVLYCIVLYRRIVL